MRLLQRLACLVAALSSFAFPAIGQSRIEVTVPGNAPLHGHLIVVIAKREEPEPRMQMEERFDSAQGFGVDVDGTAPGGAVVVDEKTFGYPLRSLAEIPAGDYFVQAVFNVYEQFHMGDGRTLWLAPDKGEGQKWNRKPGNPYSKPVRVHLDPASKTPIKLTLDQVEPPLPDPGDAVKGTPAAKWLKYVTFKSPKLSAFYGRDMYLHAWVLLPDGFEEHPDAHYPMVVYQDHYSAGMRPQPFQMTPQAPGGGRGGRRAAALGTASPGYVFYQSWTNGTMPRVILMYVQNANPFYDDSYDVDSANVGPYGSAINEELIPMIERQYRGIGQGWARATFGGSTGGWEAAATQILYPDLYNGAYVACPDPVDFHGYQGIDLYNDSNAFYRQGDFGKIAIAADRLPNGSITAETGQEFAFEYVLGTHGRSTEQWNIWQAVFSPVGKDGYPAEVIDPKTGAIDKQVVQYWHDHWDLNAILERDWPTLGPKLAGKLHFAVGDGDTYFLNNAVHLMEQSLKDRNPPSDATFQYGPGMPHCYTGGPSEYTMAQNSAMWAERVIPQMVDHMLKTAPKGADVVSWRY